MLALLLESAIRSLGLGAAVWVGLKAARVRSTRVQMTAWTLVLMAAVFMPALMRWPTVTITAPSVPLVRWAPSPARNAPVPPKPAGGPAADTRVRPGVRPTIPWQGILGCCYVAGAIVMLARLLTGLTLTWRLWRAARPVARGVRSSEALAAPVTFGSTVLLPAECVDWNPAMRQAVLAHERSHVEHADFYIQLLASLYRAAFWFNPLAWWLRNRLAELAETRSDDAAMANFPDRALDRALYAGILLDFSKKVQRVPVAVAMARPAAVARRVERILAGTPLSDAMNWRKKTFLIMSMAPLITLVAGCSVHARAQGPAPAALAPAQTASQTTTIPQVSETDSGLYAIVSGNSVLSMIGSRSDSRRALMLRDKIQEDYIWFERDLKFYYITDAALVASAKDLLGPEDDLIQRQSEFSEQQAMLAEQQARLGEQQALNKAFRSDELDALRMQLNLIRDQIGQGELAEMQSRLGELQARLAEAQAQVAGRQAHFGEEQAMLGKTQSELGAQQARLGAQQAQLAEEALRRMRDLLDEAVRRGLARPVE